MPASTPSGMAPPATVARRCETQRWTPPWPPHTVGRRRPPTTRFCGSRCPCTAAGSEAAAVRSGSRTARMVLWMPARKVVINRGNHHRPTIGKSPLMSDLRGLGNSCCRDAPTDGGSPGRPELSRGRAARVDPAADGSRTWPGNRPPAAPVPAQPAYWHPRRSTALTPTARSRGRCPP